MRIVPLFFLTLWFSACMSLAAPADAYDHRGQAAVVRDSFGVAHIYADEVYGLFYGYGYAIAQDRLFQLEMLKRGTQGRVAEVLGPEHIELDKSVRTHFNPASIKKQIIRLGRGHKDILTGYADGINAWIREIERDLDRLLPRQFLDFDFRPEPWTAYDVAMIYVGTMINQFGDMNSETENLYILKTLIERHGEETAWKIFDQLIPRSAVDGAPTTSTAGKAYPVPAGGPGASRPRTRAAGSIAQAPKPTLRLGNPGSFSSAVLIGRGKAAGAAAILVGGPQFGFFSPSYSYSVGLHGGGFDVVGNAPLGYPAVLFGHNGHIAWGSTYGAGDQVDLYAEILEPDRPDRYLFKGTYRSMEKRTEVIRVKGGQDIAHTVFRTVHGPVILFFPEQGLAYSKKRTWEGRELDQLFGCIESTKARNFPTWLQGIHRVSESLNFFYADRHGNIGHFFAGRYPRRRPGHDGRLPAFGTGQMEWLGLECISGNPSAYNPSQGFIANWNNSPAPGYPGPDIWWYMWGKADRVAVLLEALEGRARFTPEEVWNLVGVSSHADINARFFVPYILRAYEDAPGEDLAAILEAFAAWDYQSRDEDRDGRYDELATAVSLTFLPIFLEAALADDLGELFDWFGEPGHVNLGAGTKALYEALAEPEAQAFDFFNGVDPLIVIRTSLVKATDQLRSAFGSDPDGWRLPVDTMEFSAISFFGMPQAGPDESFVLSPAMNRGTINYMVALRPTGIVGHEVTPPGQSAFIAPDGARSPHYMDQLQMYADFGKKRIWRKTVEVFRNLESVSVLRYRRPAAFLRHPG